MQSVPFFGISNGWNLLLQPVSSRSILTGLTKETHSLLPDDKVGEEAETVRIYRFGEGTPQVGNWISEEGNFARLDWYHRTLDRVSPSEQGIRDLLGGGALLAGVV